MRHKAVACYASVHTYIHTYIHTQYINYIIFSYSFLCHLHGWNNVLGPDPCMKIWLNWQQPQLPVESHQILGDLYMCLSCRMSCMKTYMTISFDHVYFINSYDTCCDNSFMRCLLNVSPALTMFPTADAHLSGVPGVRTTVDTSSFSSRLQRRRALRSTMRSWLQREMTSCDSCIYL